MKHHYFRRVEIGQPYPRSLDDQGAEFTWQADRLELIMTFQDPSPAENQAVTSGVFEVALNVVEQIPILCFRIFQVEPSRGYERARSATLVLPWQECPFHLAQISPNLFPALDEVRRDPECRLQIAAVLTDLQTTRVTAFRYFSISPFFSRSLVNALLQTFPCYTPHSYPQAVEKVFAQFPLNTIGHNARIRCQSGD